jgi:hypothetical protein
VEVERERAALSVGEPAEQLMKVQMLKNQSRIDHAYHLLHTIQEFFS